MDMVSVGPKANSRLKVVSKSPAQTLIVIGLEDDVGEERQEEALGHFCKLCFFGMSWWWHGKCMD